MIDVNVSLGRWPFRRLPLDEPDRLARFLRQRGVGQAWSGSFDALLHGDLAAVNARLAEDCRRHGEGLFVPFGVVDPRRPDWREDLRRCHEDHKMPGLRLHPNYHGYGLDDPACLDLLREAADRGLIVQVAVTMEDERTQHPLVRVPPVDTAPLGRILAGLPTLRVVLLNALGTLRGGPLRDLLAAGQASVEIATLEGIGGLERLLRDIPIERALFGSHCPFFVWDSARLKLEESDLSASQREAITTGNARRLLPR